jgi:hypothetical protein
MIQGMTGEAELQRDGLTINVAQVSKAREEAVQLRASRPYSPDFIAVI